MKTSITEKYSAKNFQDMYIEKNIVDLFNMFIYDINNLNMIIHGGPGSGKTSILNMIIKEYYGIDSITEKYNENILFINNSKDQGINYFRTDVKTFCQTPCSIKQKNKIIAIDDIDILNEQSQQVFRNYINNYSHNVFFIFTCTNLQKIIESIQSRQTIIVIPGVNNSRLEQLCNKIILDENIEIDSDAKKFLINISNGSIRVLFNYLEKFKLIEKKITYKETIKLCTNINFEEFQKYIQSIKNKKMNDSIQILIKLYDDGYSVMDILDSLFIFIKLTSQIEESIKYDVISYICKYIHVFHDIHEHEIELAFFTNNISNIFNKYNQ